MQTNPKPERPCVTYVDRVCMRIAWLRRLAPTLCLAASTAAAAPGDVFNCTLEDHPRLRHFMVSRGDGRSWSDSGPVVPETWAVSVIDTADSHPYHAIMQGPAGGLVVFSVMRDRPLESDAGAQLFRQYPARWLDAAGLGGGVCRLVPAAMQE